MGGTSIYFFYFRCQFVSVVLTDTICYFNLTFYSEEMLGRGDMLQQKVPVTTSIRIKIMRRIRYNIEVNVPSYP